MFRVSQPVEAVEALVRESMHAAGIPERAVRRDEHGRLVGVKRAMSATGMVIADLGAVSEAEDATYVSIVGRYTPRSQVPYVLGWGSTPKVTDAVRREFRERAGESLERV